MVQQQSSISPKASAALSKKLDDREEDVRLFFQYATTRVFDKETEKLIGQDMNLRNILTNRNCKLVTYVVNKFYNKKSEHKQIRDDLLQEGNFGLISAVEKFDPHRGFKFSTYACVPLTTQILTQKGWKFYDQIQEGDKTLGYNKDGKSEWTSIQGVTTYDDAPLVRFGDSLWSAVCTPQHKWLMSENGKVELKPLTEWPESVETPQNRNNVQLITSTPYVGGSCLLTPDEAAVLAWILSDGSLYNGRITPSGAVVVQSQKKFVNKIRELLKRTGAYCSDTKRGNNCLGFNIKASVFRTIWEKSRLKDQTMSDLVLDLTVEARAAWFQAWRDAEGTQGRRLITQNKGEKLEALELCAFLEGYPGVHTTDKTDKCAAMSWHMRNRTPRRSTVVPEGRGSVWCPKTELGSWTARTEEGFLFLTGNTWWIRHAINNYLLSLDPHLHVPSHIRTAQNKVLKTMKDKNMGFKDLVEENAEELGVSEKMLESINASLKSKWISSVDEIVNVQNSVSGEKTTLKDLLVNQEAVSNDSITDYRTLVGIVKRGLQTLSDRERSIILLRYNVISAADIAEKHE